MVFDKITENVSELHNRATYTEIVNISLNQVLMRSINTSLTSLLPIGSLLFVGSLALGADTLREFALALFIGITLGTYSSIFVAAPILARLKETEPEWERARRRAARRRGEQPSTDDDQVVRTDRTAGADRNSGRRASSSQAAAEAAVGFADGAHHRTRPSTVPLGGFIVVSEGAPTEERSPAEMLDGVLRTTTGSIPTGTAI